MWFFATRSGDSTGCRILGGSDDDGEDGSSETGEMDRREIDRDMREKGYLRFDFGRNGD